MIGFVNSTYMRIAQMKNKFSETRPESGRKMNVRSILDVFVVDTIG